MLFAHGNGQMYMEAHTNANPLEVHEHHANAMPMEVCKCNACGGGQPQECLLGVNKLASFMKMQLLASTGIAFTKCTPLFYHRIKKKN